MTKGFQIMTGDQFAISQRAPPVIVMPLRCPENTTAYAARARSGRYPRRMVTRPAPVRVSEVGHQILLTYAKLEL